MSFQPCPCGSQKRFEQCCQPRIEGIAPAPTPEALMRSRYTAFCRGSIDYLIATHHPSKRQASDRRTLQNSINSTEWLSLMVLNASPPTPTDSVGFVEFAAFYKRGDFGQLHERSQFIKENGRWFYLQGQILPPIIVHRNDPCWCGSRKKYKHCHGR
jgi:SEC-C motif-containing protein